MTLPLDRLNELRKEHETLFPFLTGALIAANNDPLGSKALNMRNLAPDPNAEVLLDELVKIGVCRRLGEKPNHQYMPGSNFRLLLQMPKD